MQNKLSDTAVDCILNSLFFVQPLLFEVIGVKILNSIANAYIYISEHEGAALDSYTCRTILCIDLTCFVIKEKTLFQF